MKTESQYPIRNLKIQWGVWLLYGGLSVGALLMMVPFWVMGATSLLTQDQVFQTPPVLFPWPFAWKNYQRLFQEVPIGLYFWNSLWVAILTTIGQVFLSAMAAYGFSRMNFPYKNQLFFVFLITLMVPPQVNIVPLFFMMKEFHWMNTYWALIVPGLFSAFGVFLLRQWFNSFPKELEEAARMDGCNPWQIFWKIALPLSLPALSALAIFAFIGSWNSFMWPLLVTYSDEMRTLPVGISALKGSFRDTTDWPLLMAATTLSVLPVVGVFLWGQRFFMKGLLMGSVKE
jgi:multiple sugar transport system permease protein